MNYQKIKYLIVLLVIAFVFSCEDIEFSSEVPEISFKDFRIADTTLIFTFIDGDGDIGLEQSDTTGPFNPDSIYYYNLFTELFKWQDTSFVQHEFKLPPNFRILRIPTPEGVNKTVNGDIEVKMKESFPVEPSDSFYYRFYIYDRALNKSNVDSTIPVRLQHLLDLDEN